MTSVYGREEFVDYIKKNLKENNIIAINIEKANKMLLSIGVDFPEENTVISSDNSIAYTLDNVKYPRKYLSTHLSDILAINIEKADVLANIGVQFPKSFCESLVCFNDSIAYTLDNVKYPQIGERLLLERAAKGNIIAVHNKKAEKLFQSIGKKYPEPDEFIRFTDTISYTLDNVKCPQKNIQEGHKNNIS